MVRRCCLLWRHRIPLKIKIFGWLLIRGRQMMRSLRQRYVPEADVGCVMCSGATEDCTHLFFECPLVQPVWTAAALGGIDATSAAAFWRSISGAFSAGGRVEDHFRHFMGDMAPPERDHLQGSTPLHRRGTT